MKKIFISLVIFLSSCLPAHVKEFSIEWDFNTERCLNAFYDPKTNILMDRVIESDISSEMRRVVDMVVKNKRGIPYVLRLEYVTSLGDMRDEDDTSGECYVLVARPGNGG